MKETAETTRADKRRFSDSLPAVLSIAAGSIVWLASPLITGQREPWDETSGIYEWYLFATGMLLGLAFPRRWWHCPLGVWLGQAIGFFHLALTTRSGPLAILGFLFFLPMSSGISAIGAVIGMLASKTFLWAAKNAGQRR